MNTLNVRPAGLLRKWLAGFAVLALVLGVGFVACDKDGDDDDGNTGGGGSTIPAELVGKWGHGSTASLEINADGSGTLTGLGDVKWSVSETTLNVTVTIAGTSTTGSATWAIDKDGKLMLTDGQGAYGAALIATCTAGALEKLGGTSGGDGNGDGGTPNTVATPTANPAGATYTEAQSVTLSCATSDAKIYYTTDGTNPTASSTEYTAAISVSATTTIKAIAVKDGTSSGVMTETYTVNLPAAKWVATGGYGKIAASVDGDTWVAADTTNSGFESTSVTTGIYGVAYGGADGAKKWVAVGTGGKIATSTNGRTWAAVTNSTFGDSNINAVAYGGGMWFAVGDNGKMATSTDGTSWTVITSTYFDSSSSIKTVAYGGAAGNEKFFVGGSASAAYVPTTSTWSYSSPSIGTVYGAVWGNNWVAGGDNPGGTASSSTSTNAGRLAWGPGTNNTWTALTPSTTALPTGIGIKAVAYSATSTNRWVAVGTKGHIMYSQVASSGWTKALNPGPFNSTSAVVRAVTYGDGKWIAVGNDGSSIIAKSTDGRIWEKITQTAFNHSYGSMNYVYAIAYGGD